MYFVKYGTRYLHDPRTDTMLLTDLSLTQNENGFGYCDFTIYPDHPYFGYISQRNLDDPIEVYENDTCLFSGYIYSTDLEFQLDCKVKCEGALGLLKNTIVRPYCTSERSFGNKAPENPDEFFVWLISQHNAQVSENQRLTVGINELTQLGHYIYAVNDDYPTTWDELENTLLNEYGGYVRIRKEDNVRYIDYIADWTHVNPQKMEFGVNLLDYTQSNDITEIYNAVIPLGAELSQTEYPYDDGMFLTEDTTRDLEKVYYWKAYDEVQINHFEPGIHYWRQYSTWTNVEGQKAVDGIEYYTYQGPGIYNPVYVSEGQALGKGVLERGLFYKSCDDEAFNPYHTYYTYTEGSYEEAPYAGKFLRDMPYYEYDEDKDQGTTKLTITDLGDGAYYGNTDIVKRDDMLMWVPSVEAYGLILKTVEDSEITVKTDLLEMGVEELIDIMSPWTSIEIKAIDMHMIEPSIEAIAIGDYVRVVSPPHKFDSYLLCMHIDIDLNNPENTSYTLGTDIPTLTGQTNKRINELNSKIKNINEVLKKMEKTKR